MNIEIAFNNSYKNIKNECVSAYVKDGFLKVKDNENVLHCYNTAIVTAYHIEFDDGYKRLLDNISKQAHL